MTYIQNDDPARLAAIEAIEREISAGNRRRDELMSGYHEDTRKLYKVWLAQTGSSQIAGDILRVLHHKSGKIDPTDLYQLDTVNLSAAMRLIEICATPSMLSDRGLTYDGEGNPLLSAIEAEALDVELPDIEMTHEF